MALIIIDSKRNLKNLLHQKLSLKNIKQYLYYKFWVKCDLCLLINHIMIINAANIR